MPFPSIPRSIALALLADLAGLVQGALAVLPKKT